MCCFVTNEQMRLSVERMPEEVDNSLADADMYLNTTDRQINALFKDNYDLLRVTLNHILDRKFLVPICQFFVICDLAYFTLSITSEKIILCQKIENI